MVTDSQERDKTLRLTVRSGVTDCLVVWKPDCRVTVSKMLTLEEVGIELPGDDW